MPKLKWQENALVSVEAWPEEKSARFDHDADFLKELPDVSGLDTVILEFPAFKDGRAFTQARALRRAGFKGDVRATGALFEDQVGMALRCGFTSFELERGDAKMVMARVNRHQNFYQRAVKGTPVWEKRQ